jgi:hypothetical protein
MSKFVGTGPSSYKTRIYRAAVSQRLRTTDLDDCIWRNKYLNKESKVRIYKSVVIPIMTYACETRPDSMKIKGQT